MGQFIYIWYVINNFIPLLYHRASLMITPTTVTYWILWLLLLPPISSMPDYLTVVSILILRFIIYLYNLIIVYVVFLPLESKWHKLRNSYFMSCSSGCLVNICWTKEGKENRVFNEKKVPSKKSPGQHGMQSPLKDLLELKEMEGRQHESEKLSQAPHIKLHSVWPGENIIKLIQTKKKQIFIHFWS